VDLYIEFLPAAQFSRIVSIKGITYYTEPNRNQGENIAKMYLYYSNQMAMDNVQKDTAEMWNYLQIMMQ